MNYIGNFSTSPANLLPWIKTRNTVASAILRCFNPSAESYIAKNKLKHLLIQPQDGIYYVSDRSFRSCIGVLLVCRKTILAKCIVQDAHDKMGHGCDNLQILSTIQAEFYIPGVRKLILSIKNPALDVSNSTKPVSQQWKEICQTFSSLFIHHSAIVRQIYSAPSSPTTIKTQPKDGF